VYGNNYPVKSNKKQPIASVFFRFSHRDKNGSIISNRVQMAIVDHILKKINENMVEK
jgi:hypothetical protein